MTGGELFMRCLKARVVSWLHSGQVGAVIQGIDGNATVVAVYNNGRYVEPEVIHMPNSPGDMANWGPDGPVHMHGEEQEPPAEDDEGGEPDGEDSD